MPDFPDGVFSNGLLVFGQSLSSRTVVSKGVYLSLPDTRTISIAARNRLHEDIILLLSQIDDDWALQVQWAVDSDYSEILEVYNKVTEKSPNKWVKFNRLERYERYREAMLRGDLRRERLALFFSKRVNLVPRGGKPNPVKIQAELDQLAKVISDRLELLRVVFPGCGVLPMGDVEHYHYYRQFLNPSMRDTMSESGKAMGFDDSLSILENTLSSDSLTRNEGDSVIFRFDDKYHAQFVITRWPKQTSPGIVNILTDALNRDYRITQNIFRLDAEKEIAEEEKLIRRLTAELLTEGAIANETVIEQKREKVRALSRGHIAPYKVLTVIRVWADTPDQLTERTTRVKVALTSASGLKYHQVNMPAQAKNMFFETFPGWLGGTYRKWDIYAQSDYLADMMPMGGTYTGHTQDGESLYDGGNGNLLGISTFDGSTPKHAMKLGRTRAGKSVNMIDLLTQGAPLYGFDFIVEEGLSYGLYTKLMGCEPIIIRPDGNQTLNYFDTDGLPLSSSHISAGATLGLKMVGASTDDEKNNQRLALIGEYISQLYQDSFEEWRKVDESRYIDVCRLALVVDEFRKKTLSPSENFTDAFLALKALKAKDITRFEEMLAEPTEGAIENFTVSMDTAHLVRETAFAFFEREDYPQHGQLVEMMRSSRMSHHSKDSVDQVASLLAAWMRGKGSNGNLFDGVSNIEVNGRVAHFELGYISENAKALREAAGFVIANYVRNHILRLPRGVRKRAVFEEVSKFLNMPGGDKILAEFYAQLGKYSCSVISIGQQYAQIRNSPLKSVIFGNSKTKLLMAQKDREDLDDISQSIGLSSTARDTVESFPLPQDQRGRKCSYVLYRDDSGTAGVMRNFASAEMLYAANSDGVNFDRRAAHMRQFDDPFDAVMAATSAEQRSQETAS